MLNLKSFAQLLLVGTIVIAGGAVAAGLTGAEATKAARARMEHMKGLGAAAKAIGEQLKSGAPDIQIVKINAVKIKDASEVLPTWFPAGSGQEAEPKSHALPVIWTDRAKFEIKAKALATAAAQLHADAQAEKTADIGPDMRDVGAACKGCHETFKAKDEH